MKDCSKKEWAELAVDLAKQLAMIDACAPFACPDNLVGLGNATSKAPAARLQPVVRFIFERGDPVFTRKVMRDLPQDAVDLYCSTWLAHRQSTQDFLTAAANFSGAPIPATPAIQAHLDVRLQVSARLIVDLHLCNQ